MSNKTQPEAAPEQTVGAQLPKDDPDYSATPFDDVWCTVMQTLQRRVVLLTNRLFGTNFTGDEQTEPGETEMTLLQADGSGVHRGVDADFSIIDVSGVRHVLHFVCQTKPDGSIVLRFTEYNPQPALHATRSRISLRAICTVRTLWLCCPFAFSRTGTICRNRRPIQLKRRSLFRSSPASATFSMIWTTGS